MEPLGGGPFPLGFSVVFYTVNDIFKLIIFLNLFFACVNNFIFLSKGEFLQAKVSYRKFSDNFYFIPFCIDSKFWTKSKRKSTGKEILFIGNDGRREYKLAIDIAKELSDYKFTFITSNIKHSELKSKNIEVSLFINPSAKDVIRSNELNSDAIEIHTGMFSAAIKKKNKLKIEKEFKKPLRVEGDKIIYNDDPLIYVIEDFISSDECDHFVKASDSKLERAKTIGGKDGIYHENRTGSNCWIPHSHSTTTR